MSEADLQAETVSLTDAWVFPRAFGRYVLHERLGGGGMGTVFRAWDQFLEVGAAIKVPHHRILVRDNGRERFLHEARAAARLDHPNFARVTDVGEVEGLPYLAMRFVQGKMLSACPPSGPADAADLAHTLAVALAEAHRRSVIHRDLKPANVLITPDGVPVITDFGLAVRLDRPRPDQGTSISGTLAFMAPEQLCPELAPPGPGCDIWALGVILYWMFTRRLPFNGRDYFSMREEVLYLQPDPPAQHQPGLDPGLEAVCLKALAKQIEDRFASMDDFAAALAECLAGAPSMVLAPRFAAPIVPKGPVLRPECLRFAFVGYGAVAPAVLRDRLFLDVGNDLRPGVLDHHQASTAAGSTTALVLRRPDLVLAAAGPNRAPADPFTIVLHEHPDLDAVAATWLATTLLTTGALPEGAEALARYVDKVDEGSLGMSLANPFALYAAYQRLAGRLLLRFAGSPQEGWQEAVARGLELLRFTTGAMDAEQRPLTAVDAFACPGLFHEADRTAVRADAERYQAKLRETRTKARRALLKLPGQFGGRVEVWSLRVRDVQNSYDAERCEFFKDWARTDVKHCPDGRGFAALCVFHSEGPGQVRRCILSVTPDSGATLRDLGALLDRAEADRRRQVYGVDDRVTDPATGQPKRPRQGYDNADPWYDGRGHNYTIVDSPRDGTLLTVEQIEGLFLQFGGVEPRAS